MGLRDGIATWDIPAESPFCRQQAFARDFKPVCTAAPFNLFMGRTLQPSELASLLTGGMPARDRCAAVWGYDPRIREACPI
ncbi:hypothetical protein N7486_004385 [Penicillium sp. IBT 16267x]|nr:hypothetical protein N7486_004385 [Penicillium sp. IBT 16267x]